MAYTQNLNMGNVTQSFAPPMMPPSNKVFGLKPFLWLIIVVIISAVCAILAIYQPIKLSGFGSDIASIERAV